MEIIMNFQMFGTENNSGLWPVGRNFSGSFFIKPTPSGTPGSAPGAAASSSASSQQDR
jgi:hypothetical protein